MYKAIAIVADTKKVVQNINIDKLHELRAMQKPIIDIEDLMAAIIMICKYYKLKIINTKAEINCKSVFSCAKVP